MIKTTVGEMVQARECFGQFMQLKPKSGKKAYDLQKLARMIATELADFDKTRDALIKQFGEEKDGQFTVLPNHQGFAAAYNEVCAAEVEFSVNAVAFDVTEIDGVSGAAILLCEKFCAVTAEQPEAD